MRISENDLFDYNRISAYRREIPQVDPSQVSNTDTAVDNKEAVSETGVEAGKAKEEKRELPNQKDVMEYAMGRGLRADKDLIGTEADIRQLDVEKAVNSMRRDSVLQGYQYFVGQLSTRDGMVVLKK